MNNYQFIAIEGNIGAGKTTLAHLIAKEFKAKLVLEQFQENPFLPKFYKDKEKYAFQVELSFLADRYKQINDHITNLNLFKQVTVSDYTLYKSLLFSKITLSADEYLLYKRLFDIMISTIPKPDILIYIHQELDQIKANIESRGREYEQDISQNYLESVQKSYSNFIKQQTDLKIVALNGAEIKNTKPVELLKRLRSILNTEYNNGLTVINL